MIILKKTKSLSKLLKKAANEGKKIGFVPTMGALHSGHLSLINASRRDYDITVCSIFVNPSQFNDPEDFRHYPQTQEKDIALLEPIGCDYLLMPSVEEIYPADYEKRIFDLGPLETILEGAFRPGHFQGVCEVVDQLLTIVQPNGLYLGQKDFQQCLVIKRLLKITGKEKNISIHIVPTLREPDGLAMSSRNLRLTDKQRMLASAISLQLQFIKDHIKDYPFQQLKSSVTAQLEQLGFVVDYVSIATITELREATDLTVPIVGLIAARLGAIRLIDNMLLN